METATIHIRMDEIDNLSLRLLETISQTDKIYHDLQSPITLEQTIKLLMNIYSNLGTREAFFSYAFPEIVNMPIKQQNQILYSAVWWTITLGSQTKYNVSTQNTPT